MAAALFTMALPAPSPGADLVLNLTGMMGFVPMADGGLEVLLVNEYDRRDQAEHAITHFPQLEVRCRDLFLAENPLAGAKDWQGCAAVTSAGEAELQAESEACCYWSPPMFDDAFGGYRAISLVDGFDLTFRVGDRDPTGPVILTPKFSDGVIPLGELLQVTDEADPERAHLRSEASVFDPDQPDAMKGFVIGRVRLHGGTITALGSSERWRFREPFTGKLAAGIDVASVARWEIEYDPTTTVTVEFRRLGADPATPALRTVRLKADPRDTELPITLSNEPDTFEFCMHSPSDRFTPSIHFLGFYRLTKYARGKSTDELEALPLPYPTQPQCAALEGIGGRKVQCMMSLFPGLESPGG